ncbi:MAG: ComF family protein [Planctomycetota bacterium]
MHLVTSEACPYCGQYGVKSVEECSRCHGRKRGFHRATAGAAYQGVIRDLILRLKFGGQRHAAVPLAQCLLQGLQPVLSEIELDCAVAVPLHPRRYRSRGFNQAELIAEALVRSLHIPLLKGVIRRVRNTLPQGTGGGGSRRGNVNGAFGLVPASPWTWARGEVPALAVKNCNVLLVDDVFSTGATMEECSLALLEAGARYVFAAAAAT